MAWTKINHNGNLCYLECSSCEHEFYVKEVCYKKSFEVSPIVIAGMSIRDFKTEIVCQKCFGRRKLVMGKDKTKKTDKKSK